MTSSYQVTNGPSRRAVQDRRLLASSRNLTGMAIKQTLASGAVVVRHGFAVQDARSGVERRGEALALGPRSSGDTELVGTA